MGEWQTDVSQKQTSPTKEKPVNIVNKTKTIDKETIEKASAQATE